MGDVWLAHRVPPAIVGFLDQDYRYKSVASQIPLHRSALPGIEPETAACEAVTQPLRYGGRL